ncbi:MAG: hypothetical protein A2166_02660 [Omnitrophica WOR_2 bacterium RBG_13_41_10]|nr:MAG: hypothetical protein A2166_02660 [Omnitrophica WOR_2 bacterium RBG_13_41_10]
MVNIDTKEQCSLKKEIQEYWTKNVPILNIGLEKFSHLSKEFYLEVDNLRLRYEPFAFSLIDSFAGEGLSILEIGCGLGYDSRYMAKKGLKVVSLDLSFRNVDLTLKGSSLLELDVKGICADGENLPFQNNTFDIVYSFGVLHHTPNTQKAIDEIYRVLKPQGKCFVMLYHKGYAYYFIKLYGWISLKYLSKTEDRLISDLYDHTPLSKMYNGNHAYKMFNNFRETKIGITTYGGIQNNKKFKWIYILLNKFPFLMRILGSYLIIRAVK